MLRRILYHLRSGLLLANARMSEKRANPTGLKSSFWRSVLPQRVTASCLSSSIASRAFCRQTDHALMLNMHLKISVFRYYERSIINNEKE